MEYGKLSILSAFIRQKIKDKGWTVKKFAELCNMSESHAYELVGAKRDFTPTEEMLNKIADVLELSGEDRDYIFDIARRERETGGLIYPEETVPGPGPEPSEPGLPESSPGEPAPSGPGPLPTPEPGPPDSSPEESAPLPEPEPGHDPSPPTEPQPSEPGPPASEPSPPHPEPEPSEPEAQPQLPGSQEPGGNLAWFGKNKKIIIAGVVILVGMALLGCCLVSMFLWPFGL